MWRDLSDDELMARLVHHAGTVDDDSAAYLAALVRDRDDDETAATITRLLDA